MLRFGRLLLAVALTSVPVHATTRIERELALDPGGQVVLDTSGAGVNVVGSTRSGVRVVITSKEDIEAKYDVEFTEDPDTVSVRIERKHALSRWFGWFHGGGLRLDVEVPADARVEVDTSGGAISVEDVRGELRLDTSGGAIHGTNVGGDVLASTSGGAIVLERVGGDVRAESSGGSIRVEAAAGSVEADTSGGGVEIRDAGGDVRAESSGGGIRVFGAHGRVDADTSGGPVQVEFAPGNASGGTLSSSGGGVTVGIDPTIGLEVDASSSGGSVVADVPVRVRGEISKSQLRGTIGAGGALLKLRSSGGGIRIEQAGAAAAR